MLTRRASGILLHVTSLPSPYGIGDLGKEAYAFVDFLHRSGQSFWQVLPLNPIRKPAYSPYNADSAFAGNPLLISPDLLFQDGLLAKKDLPRATLRTKTTHPGQVNFKAVIKAKSAILERAFQAFQSGNGLQTEFQAFCEREKSWLTDFAAFKTVQRKYPGKKRTRFPQSLRKINQKALAPLLRENAGTVHREKFIQFLFFRQWFRLKACANEKGIQIIGDLPFYVSSDSADVWAQPGLFKLNADGSARAVSGVPPDRFSRTGQLWNNPVYNWTTHAKDGYAWWIHRLEHNFRLFDLVRIDHFRGFAAYWEIPAGSKTAQKGKWVQSPGRALFDRLLSRRIHPPLIAEDLGVITADVRELVRQFRFPGMKVLAFAFDGRPGENPYLLHHHEPNAVLYTGTHDNNTLRGWFENEADKTERQNLARYLGGLPRPSDIHRRLVRHAMSSVCRLAVFPVQDILGLGQNARMNRPAVQQGNWGWRLGQKQLTPQTAAWLAGLTETYGRR